MWIRDIDVSAELIEAARAGRLVVFVGAGASIDPPASLPSFARLVTDIGELTGTPVTAQDLERPDRFLGRLADKEIDVHGLVAQAVDLPESVPNRLHRAIVGLAHAHPPVRIITTNYDHHLTTATHEVGLEPDVFYGPALPVGDDFVGVAHLHGALGQAIRRLIVTDTDFGHAYLREAWAARFLERMFSAYTVVFIGYSHGDIVMQYLARSLGRDGRRFVFTHEGDLPQWESLGLTPVPYELRGDSHEALSETLERWAELASLGSTGHRLLITEMVTAEQPTTVPEEVDYLEDALRDPERVRYFVEGARGHRWLAWVADRAEFATLFAQTPTTDQVAPEVTSALTTWITDHYMKVEFESHAALRVMRAKPWTPSTWTTITHGLLTQDGRVPDWQLPWLVLAFDQTPAGRTDLLDMILNRASWGERLGVAMMLLEYRTRPVATPSIDFGEVDNPPYFQVELVGDERLLTEAWTTVFKPSLEEHAEELLDLFVGQLRAAYRMLWTLHPTSEALSFGRSAIEPHNQDDLREPIDVLIDAVRDCLEHLLAANPAAAIRVLGTWATADEGLFRRLAMHGYRLRTDLTPDDKVRWVCDQGLLYDLDAQHEVFLLLKDSVPEAGEELVRALLEVVAAGPPDDDEDTTGGTTADNEEDGGRPSQYRRYNLLVWLAQAAPDSEQIAEALRKVQEENPQYQPRSHPDLNMYMETFFGEDVEPFTADELHAKVHADADAALTEVRSYDVVDDRFGSGGPDWQGALNAVRACVTKYPDDGLILSPLLQSSDRDLRSAMVNAWSSAELSDDHVAAVIDVALGWDPDQIRNPTARMLANGGDQTHPTKWHRVESARELAARLWPDEQVTGNIDTSEDLHAAAINHPTGDLAQFWTKVIAYEWDLDRENWKGIPANVLEHVDKMLTANGRNGLFARAILGSQLHFYFNADPDLTRAHLLPLFNWDAHPDDAQAVWQGFLAWGRHDDTLLDDGLLAYYLQTCTHTGKLGRERATEQLAAHLASVAVAAAADPTTWLSTFTTDAPEQLRLMWTRRVAHLLGNLTPDESEAQWTRWIRDYWTGRAASVPLPLTPQEAASMATWVLGLPTNRADAIDLVEQTSAGLDKHDRLLHSLSQTDVASDPLNWARFLTALMRATSTPSWSLCHYLQGIVQELKAADPTPDLSDIVDRAMKLGCTGAPDW